MLLPVSRISQLRTAYPSVRIQASPVSKYDLPMERDDWPTSATNYEDNVVGQYVSGGTALNPLASITPPDDTTTFKDDLTAKLALHGVTSWHSNRIYGDGVKVGIIDWSFAGISDVPNIDRLVTEEDAAEDSTLEVNALCQNIHHSIHPESYLVFGRAPDCQPNGGPFGTGNPITHGASVAELLHDVAPNVKLYYAQANSPEQLYEAATWLSSDEIDVDVIVHAGGWQYDGFGDGTSDLVLANRPTGRAARKLDNEHSPYRYYPSPLWTVKEYATGDGPVWISAAGNAEKWTLHLDNPTVHTTVGSRWRGYVIFHDDTSKTMSYRTCQRIPVYNENIYLSAVRWEDSRTTPGSPVDFEIKHDLSGRFDRFLTQSKYADQIDGQPFRRTSALNLEEDGEACLRFRVQPPSNPLSRTFDVPNWIQFQILLAPDFATNGPTWANAPVATGRSMVNPAETDHSGLLAIGAEDMTTANSWELMHYSSGGPVYHNNAVLTTTPSRTKPDLVAGSGAATFSSWVHYCNQVNNCAAKYFGGTSAAVAHTGGMAALVIDLLTDMGVTPTAEQVADYVRRTAEHVRPVGQRDRWGQGFLRLCETRHLGDFRGSGFIRSDSWSTDDCRSPIENSGNSVDRKSDYYTFRVTGTSSVLADIRLTSSSKNTYLRLIRGHHGRTTAYNRQAQGPGRTSTIRYAYLQPGLYTVEATTTDANAGSGTYTLSISRRTSSWYSSFLNTVSTIERGGSSTVRFQFGGLTTGRYTARMTSSSSSVGFTPSCATTHDVGIVTGSARPVTVSVPIYTCHQTSSAVPLEGKVPLTHNVAYQPGLSDLLRAQVVDDERPVQQSLTGTITAAVYQGRTATGTVLDTTTHTVSVTAPVLSSAPSPTGVSAGSGSRSSVYVTWTQVTGAVKYRVQYRRSGSSTWRTATTSATGNSYRVYGLSCGSNYQFRVAAMGDGTTYSGSWSVNSGSRSARTSSCLSASPAPTSVVTSATGLYRTNISWVGSTGVTDYRVQYRAGTSGSWTTSSSAITGTSYVVRGLDCETSYQLRVQSYGDGSSYRRAWGGVSSTVTVTTRTCPPMPPAPSNFTFNTPSERDSTSVHWYTTAHIAKWKVEYRQGTSGTWLTASDTVPGSAVEYDVRGLECETAYQFRLSAYGDGKNYRYAWGPTAVVTAQATPDCEIPVFTGWNTAWLEPNAPVGTSVITAETFDETEDEVLRYRITAGNSERRFAIDSSTGEITTAKTLARGPYYLTVEVKDKLNQTDYETFNVYLLHPYQPYFQLGDFTIREGAEPIHIRVHLNKAATEPFNLPINVGYDGSVQRADFVGLSTGVLFEIGDFSKTFPVWAPVDDEIEGTEYITMHIGAGGGTRFAQREPWFVFLTIDDADTMEDVLWETTLNSGIYNDDERGINSMRGYMASGPVAVPGTLDDDDFSWNDTTYRVTELSDPAQGSQVRLEFDQDLPYDVSGLVLYIGDYQLPFAGAYHRTANALEWDIPLTLGVGSNGVHKVKLVQRYEGPDAE